MRLLRPEDLPPAPPADDGTLLPTVDPGPAAVTASPARSARRWSWLSRCPMAVLWTDTAEYRNPHYHQPSDTPDTLDYDFLAAVTRLALATIARWRPGTGPRVLDGPPPV